MTMTDFNDWYAQESPELAPTRDDFRDELRWAYEAGAASQAGTLRDEFAGQALAGVIVTCQGDTRLLNETSPEMFARKSYEVADAMLEARKTTGEGEA
jgi:hypothetical protein